VLDKWEFETVNVLSGLGNTAVNLIFECTYDKTTADVLKPTSDSSRFVHHCSFNLRLDKERWCNLKYIDRKFIPNHSDDITAVLCPLLISLQQFAFALKNGNMALLIRCIGNYEEMSLTKVMGYDVNAQDLLGKMSLHYACQQNLTTAAEFLLLWNANPNLQDQSGKSNCL